MDLLSNSKDYDYNSSSTEGITLVYFEYCCSSTLNFFSDVGFLLHYGLFGPFSGDGPLSSSLSESP